MWIPRTARSPKPLDIPGVGTVHFFVTAGAGFKELRFMATDTGTVISGTAENSSPSVALISAISRMNSWEGEREPGLPRLRSPKGERR